MHALAKYTTRRRNLGSLLPNVWFWILLKIRTHLILIPSETLVVTGLGRWV